MRLGWTSAQGYTSFDPISLFLLLDWKIVNGWSRAQALRHLAHPRYADYAQLFGFQDGVYPTERGIRHFLTAQGITLTALATPLTFPWMKNGRSR